VLVQAILVADLLDVLQGHLHHLTGAQPAHRLGEQVVALLFEEGRAAAIPPGILVCRAGRVALHHDAFDEAVARDEVHPEDGGGLGEGEEVGGLQRLVIGVREPLDQGHPGETGVDLGDDLASLQDEGAPFVDAEFPTEDRLFGQDVGRVDDGVVEERVAGEGLGEGGAEHRGEEQGHGALRVRVHHWPTPCLSKQFARGG
jgi:hypothetical protein